MANRFAVAAGNFNDTATWSTTAAGSPGASVPVAGDNAIANNRTVTITADATCDNITNGTAYGGTAGGSFVLNNGVTLAANIVHNNTNTNVVSMAGTNSANIVGNVTGASSGISVAGNSAITHSSTGTLTITGNLTGGNQLGLGSFAVNVTASGILNIIGNIQAGAGGNGSNTFSHGVSVVTGTVNVTGNVIGNSAGNNLNNAINMSGSGTVSVVGSMTAGNFNSYAIFSSSATAVLSLIGNITAANSYPAIKAAASANNVFSGNFISSANGTMPIDCTRYRVSPAPLNAKTRYALNGTGTYVDMFTADNNLTQAVPADVRSGTVYADGNLTGTLAVPAASSVGFGVPVDATTGTAALTPAAVWEYATRSLTTSSGATAAEIRTEMDSNSTKLANLDATVSSRLAPSGTLATVTTLTNAPTVPSAATIASQVRTELTAELAKVAALNTERLNNTATTAIVGNLLAQANS